MTALALCAQDLGAIVTGSDVDEPFVTDEILAQRKIHPTIGFSVNRLSSDMDLLIYTAAHQGSLNPQVVAAKQKGITAISHAQALGELMQDKVGISVCGVGGKTTTAAMLSHIIDRLGAHPSFCIGVGNIPSLHAPGRFDPQGRHFVAEADEYTVDPTQEFAPRFSYQHPKIIICTNIEFDHPDVYRNLEHTKTVFLEFFNHLPPDGLLIINADSTINQSILPHLKVKYQTYTGDLNLGNQAAAVAAAVALGFDHDQASAALSDFTGTKRRFEFTGQVGDLWFYDDYAHHPREIKATLKAAKEKFPHHQLIAIFQPHTYSRTKALLDEFSRSFTSADQVIFLPIYASAREKPDPTVSSATLAQLTPQSITVADRVQLVQYLRRQIHGSAIIITLGAGDIYQTNLWLKTQFQN